MHVAREASVGVSLVELPDAGAVGADRVVYGGVGEDGLKDA